MLSSYILWKKLQENIYPVKFWSDDNEQRFFLSNLRFIRSGLKHERVGQFLKAWIKSHMMLPAVELFSLYIALDLNLRATETSILKHR